MNERIRDLALEAIVKNIASEAWVFTDAELVAFAESIVRECADITSGLSKLFPRTDVAFDVGYTTGTTRATKEIKNHFGVKE